MKDQIVELAIQAMAESCAHFGEDIPTQAEHDELYSDEESKWFFKRFAELVRNEAQQPAPVQEPIKPPGMAVQALAGEIIEALLADEKDGGYDLTAGLFGAAFSKLVRRWAVAEWNAPQAQQPAQQEPVTEIISVDEYGPLLRWNTHWTKFPTGTKLFTAPQAQQPAPPADVPLLSLVEIADITAPWSRVRSDYTIGIARCVEQAVRQKAGLK